MDDKLEEVLESLQDEKLLTKRLLLKLFSRSWIHFAYFPCPHCSIDERLFTLETPLGVNGTWSSSFSRVSEGTPDTTRRTVLF
ncbi:hypothetical protein GBA52_020370 [Prunus armeniaca]|nr:hypothetical protein GBA52_020370 [Prunus armeniaca]